MYIQTPSFNSVFVVLCYGNIWALIHCCFSDTDSGTVFLQTKLFIESQKLRLFFSSTSFLSVCFSVQFSHSVVSNSLWPHGPQHARPPCPSPTPRVYPNSCPLNRWCHPTISSSVPFSFCPQSFPASGSFQMSQLFASDGRSIGVSASTSVLPMNTQDWSPLGLMTNLTQ